MILGWSLNSWSGICSWLSNCQTAPLQRFPTVHPTVPTADAVYYPLSKGGEGHAQEEPHPQERPRLAQERRRGHVGQDAEIQRARLRHGAARRRQVQPGPREAGLEKRARPPRGPLSRVSSFSARHRERRRANPRTGALPSATTASSSWQAQRAPEETPAESPTARKAT